ncbi:MAG TPA: C-terminal binding protein [Chloroflexota bacterium]
MAPPKVVYTDPGRLGIERARPLYEQAGVEVELLGLDHHNIDWRAYLAAMAGADAVVCHRVPVGRRAIEAAPRLKIALRHGVGYEELDVAALADAGIPACNVPDYGSEEVAMHALSMLLALRRQLFALDRSVRAGQWTHLPEGRKIHRLSRQTAGIVGLGRIGTAFADGARAIFGRVIACDPYIPAARFAQVGVERVGLEDLVRESDVITLHVPGTPETHHLIGEAQLRLMKPSAVLANTSRGPVVDQVALARALQEGWIEGAACDVWEHEPAPLDHPLLGCPNFMASSHSAWYSEEGLDDMQVKAAQEVLRVLGGQPPLYAVNDWETLIPTLSQGEREG